MQVNTTIRSVDKTLEDLTKSLPPEMINWLKQRFESVFQNLTGLDFAGIRVDFVVDTNSIINSLLRYAQGKGSILFHMINNPIFRFQAPAFIENEVSKFILTAKRKMDKNKVFEGWRKIKRALKVGTEISTNAWILSNIIIGKRDPKDVPFVAMFLDLGAKNIITYDKDFEHPLLKPLKIHNVGEIVVGVYKGLLSFFVLSEVTPATFNFMGQVILEIVKILFDTIKIILAFTSAITRNAVDQTINLLANFFPQIREWIDSGAVNAALLTLVLIVGGTLGVATINNKSMRNNLEDLINFIAKSLKPILANFINWLDTSIKFLLDCIKILIPHIMSVIVLLITNMSTVISNVKFTA